MENGAHRRPSEGRIETDPSNSPVPFGRLLKRFRQEAGLSQEALADRAGVSCRTISDLERSINQGPRGSTLRLLVDALALGTKERTALRASAYPPDEAVADPGTLRRAPAAVPTNLPLPLTNFVGREQEQAMVRRLLGEGRLVTLIGAGGCGKTRLALEVARVLADERDDPAAYMDGIWLVELAALSDEQLVARAVATALDVREKPDQKLLDTLTGFLRPKRVLLLLDNCEHLLAACAHLADALLRVCPQVTILATSREALNIGGEQPWRVPSFDLPAPLARLTLAQMLVCDAVQLFVQRARVGRPDFTLTAHNMAQVTLICRRLDGMPLAIELAAARLASVSLDQLAARLDDRFRLLTGGSRSSLPRQQTLRATLDWSYDLLDEPERLLLRRLSVFAGGWTLEAAEAVCAGEGIASDAVLDLLAGLVNKSLVLAERAGAQYRLLETVRQYGRDKLAAAGETSRLMDSHLDWYLALTKQAALHIGGAEREFWLERLEEELENLRAALQWSNLEEGRQEAGLRLASALEDFWYMRGYVGEGRRRLESLLQRGGAVSAELRGRAMDVVALLAYYQGEYTQSMRLFEAAHALHISEGDVASATWARTHQALVLIERVEYQRATMLLEEVLPAHRERGDRHGVGWSLSFLAEIRQVEGDSAQAAALHEESLAVFLELGDKHGIGYQLAHLANVAWHLGNFGQAKRLYHESLRIRLALMDKYVFAASFEGLAMVAAAEMQPLRAAQLLGAAHCLREAVGTRMDLVDRVAYDRAAVEVQATLGEAAFAAAWAVGQAMGLEEALGLALEMEPID